MSDEQEKKPAIVREAKQAGEVLCRWAWAEPAVWTLRMLTALEEGVRGGKWFSLIDKVSSRRMLDRAFEQVEAKGKGKAVGVDRQTVEMYGERQEEQQGDEGKGKGVAQHLGDPGRAAQ